MTIAVRAGASLGPGRACVLATPWPPDPDGPPSAAVIDVGPTSARGGFVLNRNFLYIEVLKESGGEVLLSTVRGQFARVVGEDVSEESIMDMDNGPMVHGMLSCLRTIGGRVYAAGMGRQVYRRTGPGAWERFDRDSLESLETAGDDAKGFQAIDGLSEDKIAACGFGGEIWLWTKGKGRRVDSPTNVLLFGLRWLTPEICLACGQKGIIVRGDGDVWTILEHDQGEIEFRHLEVFRDTAYLTSPQGLFVLREGQPLAPIGEVLPDSKRFHLLHARAGALWAFGSGHLAWTTDGKTWQTFEFKMPDAK